MRVLMSLCVHLAWLSLSNEGRKTLGQVSSVSSIAE